MQKRPGQTDGDRSRRRQGLGGEGTRTGMCLNGGPMRNVVRWGRSGAAADRTTHDWVTHLLVVSGAPRILHRGPGLQNFLRLFIWSLPSPRRAVFGRTLL